MPSARLRRPGCLNFSIATLVISISVAYVLRYWHPLADGTKAVRTHDPSTQSSSVHAHASDVSADTTAVVLNWSRFPNIRRIANLLCSPELAGVLHTVLIWNNNPKPVSYEDFDADIGCSPSRLVIVNSPRNLYFQARFVACMSANTTFCYTQDDDYLILPEILRSLHTRVSKEHGPQSVHLLPPHERLSSELRYVCNEGRGLHTSFAWLGHGAILRRSLVQRFLSSMQLVNATEEQLLMADNYYSVLLNEPPEVWFDQGIELGGGQAFTVGSEGELRNRRHIMQAGLYLDSLLNARHDFGGRARKCDDPPPELIGRAPCTGRPCILETSIRMLPVLSHAANSTTDMLDNEERHGKRISDDALDNNLTHAPSKAVDSNKATAFRSLSVGRKGDYVTLDMLVPQVAAGMIWLVDEATARLLQHCVYESSVNATRWVSSLGCNVRISHADGR
ncbi:hypothetical protein PENSPDRAFT_578573 [Peniophora sp. CONT]|nr:hypothetical protein PENSPDRAFT_578573 [Peniophora sp. CONT]